MTVVSVLLPLVGATMVVTVAWDVVLTTIHPGLEGRLSRFANRASWRAARGLVRVTGKERLLGWSGPGAMVLNFVLWLAGLLLGYALVYVPFLGQFRGVPQPQGFVDALYISGVALTTVGFGDLVATTRPFRLVLVAEAATGLAMFTAAIAYLLSVYPLFIGLRGTASKLSDRDLTDPREATRALLAQGETLLEQVHDMLVRSHGHVRSFPVLYYFNPVDREESIYTVLRTGFTLLLIWRSGIAHAGSAGPGTYAAALERRLSRIISDYTGRRPRWASEPDVPDVGGDPEEQLRAIVASVDPAAARSGPAADPGYAASRQRADAFLALVAADRGYPHEPLLVEPPTTAP